MRSSNTGRRTSSVAPAVWHVALSCCNQILLFNFCEQKFVQHGPLTIAIDCNGLYLLIFEEKWPNYGSEPKSAPNRDSFWVHRLFNVCVQVFYAPNATILLVYIPATIKMGFIWKDDFFAKIGNLSNQTWAKFYHARNKLWLKKNVRWRTLYLQCSDFNCHHTGNFDINFRKYEYGYNNNRKQSKDYIR